MEHCQNQSSELGDITRAEGSKFSSRKDDLVRGLTFISLQRQSYLILVFPRSTHPPPNSTVAVRHCGLEASLGLRKGVFKEKDLSPDLYRLILMVCGKLQPVSSLLLFDEGLFSSFPRLGLLLCVSPQLPFVIIFVSLLMSSYGC